MNPTGLSALSVAAVSAASLVGSLSLLMGEAQVRKAIYVLVAFAVGAMFGNVFLHLLPSALQGAGPYAVLAGFLGFFALEKFIRWRHCHLTEGGHAHPVVGLALVGDAVHNLLDGLVIAAAYQLDLRAGLATTLAVFLHEIPQELGDYGVLLHGGLSPRQALLFNVLSALVAFAGWGLAWLAASASTAAAPFIGAFAAGGFLYVAGSDLVPELHHETGLRRSAVQFLGILCGVAGMALLAGEP